MKIKLFAVSYTNTPCITNNSNYAMLWLSDYPFRTFRCWRLLSATRGPRPISVLWARSPVRVLPLYDFIIICFWHSGVDVSSRPQENPVRYQCYESEVHYELPVAMISLLSDSYIQVLTSPQGHKRTLSDISVMSQESITSSAWPWFHYYLILTFRCWRPLKATRGRHLISVLWVWSLLQARHHQTIKMMRRKLKTRCVICWVFCMITVSPVKRSQRTQHWTGTIRMTKRAMKSIKEWVSCFLGSWEMNRSAGQTNCVNRKAVLVRFVCSALRFIPHEPRKKDTHFLNLHCLQQRPFLKFSEKSYQFKIPIVTGT